MTYLELCQRLRLQAGIEGDGPSNVTNQTGQYKRVVQWVNQAYLEIQRRHWNWLFLWRQHDQALVESAPDVFSRDLDISGTPVDRIIETSFSAYDVDLGEDKSWSLQFIEWRDFARRYDKNVTDRSKPQYVTRLPDGGLRLYPLPDKEYHITFEYYRTPHSLAANLDEPLLPVRFQPMIIHQALVYYGVYENAPEVVQGNSMLMMPLMKQLEEDQLPKVVIARRCLA